MKLPFPNDLPDSIRRIGRTLLPSGARKIVASGLQRLAHLQSRRDPCFAKSLEMLGALRDRHKGETCVIAGNGPSLRDFDLADVADVPTFSLNRGYLKWREANSEPDYAVAVNDLVIEQFHEELSTLACPLFVPWQHRKLFGDQSNTIFFEPLWGDGFSGNATRGIRAGSTVTYCALQFAYHMGFARAVLVGVDHRFSAKGTPHAEVLQTQDDPDHFTGNYFGPGVRWNLPDLKGSERDYATARHYFEKHGRCIVNATDGSALEIFERCSLEAALSIGG